MANIDTAYYALNRGLVSPLALGRVDVDRLSISAEEQTNIIPRVFGSASFRPGTEYIASGESDGWWIPFVFATDDTALVEFSDSEMRVYVDEAIISRGAVSTVVTNGTFAGDISGWANNDESGATSAYSSLSAGLTGTGINAAILEQEVTVAVADRSADHGIDIQIERGPVSVKVGTSSGGQDLFSGTLGEGFHSIEINPGGASSFFIELSNRRAYEVLVFSVEVSSGGEMVLTSPYRTADLPMIRHDQSADVVYLACEGYQQYKIERRSARSWSLVKYLPEDGPYRNENTSNLNLTASAISGSITLTASQPLFRAGHEGALFRIESTGQLVQVDVTAENTFTDEIRVTGIGNTRRFTLTLSGTWSATVTLQRSIGAPGSWVDVDTYSSNGAPVIDDGLDNQITFYRVGVKSGDYSSGTSELQLEYSGGSIVGVVRVTQVSSETVADALVLDNLGNTGATTLWAEGSWSLLRGYPSAVALFEGRLWWAGKDRIWGSVSDGFESFDDFIEGDSGPLNRSIGQGPVDRINWLLALERLVIGADNAEKVARSSSFDEPLTPTAFAVKNSSTQGSAELEPAVLDSSGLFVQRSGLRLYQLAYDGGRLGYVSNDMTKLHPLVCSPGIEQIAVQRQPDTRIHCVLSSGAVAMMVFEEVENVRAWVRVETRAGDQVKQCVVLPGVEEDNIYYIVDRSVNGSTVRYLEKWSLETENQGGTVNKCVDSLQTFTAGASQTAYTLTHLAGEDVVVWTNGDSANDENGDIKAFTANGSGVVTIDSPPPEGSTVVIGLAYRGRFKSAKLATGFRQPIGKKKIVKKAGLLLGPTHRKGIKFGPDYTNMDPMPNYEDGAVVTEDHTAYDQETVTFPGTWGEDSRVCLEMNSPRHATVMAVTIELNV